MNSYIQPEQLIRYQPSVQIHQNMKTYHRQKPTNEGNPPSPKLQDIIDSILPPRDWNDHNNKLHIQYVSHQPSSREDVLELTERLDRMLEERQAKITGVCPIREGLYSQVFDEVIRQVAVDCPERGLLLMRVRDQHKMTLAAYQTIYQYSISYGMRKQVESQAGSDLIQQQFRQLSVKKEQLQAKRSLLLCRRDLMEKEIKENRAINNDKRDDELKFLKLQKDNMVKFLEAVRTQFSH